jgi:MFS family permease
MRGRAYRQYALGAVTAVYSLNLTDRGLMMLLLQSMKDDLHLSDTQLGFLTGIAFALFYATFGVPIARWADRSDRAAIASLAIALWGVTVMCCVIVTSYGQLVLARIAAAVGEAGCKPPTYSLVGDYFPRAAERTRAMGIYWLGNPFSSLISFGAGGWLNARYGWRFTFFVMGAMGLVLAAIVKLTVTDPRSHTNQIEVRGPRLPPMKDVFAVLWH